MIKLPRKGYKSITVSDAFYDQLSDAAKAEGLSMPALVLMMLEGQYPEHLAEEAGKEKDETDEMVLRFQNGGSIMVAKEVEEHLKLRGMTPPPKWVNEEEKEQ